MNKKRFKMLFATDFHGSEVCFRKWVNAGKFYECDVLIMGGDVTGKVLVPLIRRADGVHVDFLSQRHILTSDEEITKMIDSVHFNGMYPYPCDETEFNRLESDLVYREQVFNRAMEDGICRWMKLADERLKGTDILAYATGGNDDHLSISDSLRSGERVKNVDDSVTPIGDYFQMLSSGWSNPTPWKTPREVSEEELLDKLNALADQLDPKRKTIFNVHVPPYNSTLDIAPQLDDELRPVLEGGGQVMVPVGSIAVRTLIERVQPLISLHGHIHESRGVTRIGKTLVINPGSNYNAGVLQAAMIVLDDQKGVVSHQLING